MHGLDVVVVRPSAVCGHSVTGYANGRDGTNLLLAAAVAVKGAVNCGLPMRWVLDPLTSYPLTYFLTPTI